MMKQSGSVLMDRPVRWDHPLDREMANRDLQWMLEQPPFSTMNRDAFPSHGSLEDILRNDCRLHRFEPGDLIVREGAYGNSAFLVLRGSVCAFLEPLWQRDTPSEQREKTGFLESIRNWIRHSKRSQEDRREGRRTISSRNESRPLPPPIQLVERNESGNRIFLQDINALMIGFQSEPLGIGEIFGEMAAITRTQHRYTVIADSPTVVLEIRWQGLRMLRRDKGFREYLDSRYRETSLKTHLRETPLFRFLSPESLERVTQATKLESFGDMEWFGDYESNKKLEIQKRIDSEPLIASEGKSANDLLLVRAGFARVSFELGSGHQTTSYLGRGRMFGLEEIAHDFRSDTSNVTPYQQSLRALGFVDILRIPRAIVLEEVIPQVRRSELPPMIRQPRYDSGGLVVSDQPLSLIGDTLRTPLIEFLVDERLINGKRTMLIDLDCCTQCDDCVKACANTHGGTPRFVRNGPQFGPFLFAHACMHCEDPVCMIGCPTGAIARNTESGVVSIDANICIGCKTCAESCPYDNIVMVERRDDQGRVAVDRQTQLPILNASKCDFCKDIAAGPACQNACPHNALVRIDTSDFSSLQQRIANRKVS